MITLATLVARAACTPLVLALQAQTVNPPPTPSRAMPLTSAVLGYAIMAIFGAGIIGISLLRSKRGHLD